MTNAGLDNYGQPKSAYLEQIAAMDDKDELGKRHAEGEPVEAESERPTETAQAPDRLKELAEKADFCCVSCGAPIRVEHLTRGDGPQHTDQWCRLEAEEVDRLTADRQYLERLADVKEDELVRLRRVEELARGWWAYAQPTCQGGYYTDSSQVKCSLAKALLVGTPSTGGQNIWKGRPRSGERITAIEGPDCYACQLRAALAEPGS